MSDGAFPDRVTLLRNRWEADPSSRVFLQLAEEYRHQGRVKEALAVLDRGLKEHPGYLAALVAKGRCHLELAEPQPARVVLERVVKQDATQMVAIKLLVRAYLDTGEPDRARERLDIYTLLNDSDPEIEELRRRLRAMEQPPQAPQAEKPGSTPPSDSPFPEAPSADVQSREAPPSLPAGDIFDLGFPSPRVMTSMDPDEPFADLLAPAPAAAVPPAPAAAPSSAPATLATPATPTAAAEIADEPEEEPEPEDILFSGLASRESRHRYLTGLAAEGLFLLDLTGEAPPGVARMQEPLGEPILARAAGFEPQPLAAEGLAASVSLAEEPWLEEPPPETADLAEDAAEQPAPPVAAAPAALPGEPIATATLGEIYLKQGHLGEAERIFREVLRREPDNSAAQEGLARAAVPQPGGRPFEAKARKIQVLNSYLQRLRRGSRRDVS